MPVDDNPKEGFDSYDLRELETAPSPQPSPTLSDDSPSGSEVEVELPSFNDKWKLPFEGLLFLGALTKTFIWMGHTFKIRTMTNADQLEVGLVQSQYNGTLGEIKAYQGAVCAACIVSVDNKPLPIPISNTPEDTLLQTRFEWINHNWFPWTIDAIYDAYLNLEATVSSVIEAMVGGAPFEEAALETTPSI